MIELYHFLLLIDNDITLEEEVYIEQSQDYKVERNEDKFLNLKRTIWVEATSKNLKCSNRQKSILKKFHQDYKHALYVKVQNDDVLIMCLYVNNLIFTSSNPSMMNKFKEGTKNENAMLRK